ncbi:RF-1 domain-containing protein [Nemania sp. NC0429]|nr:RF-1 domain-containing protein [Nemania sp. NC0429]
MAMAVITSKLCAHRLALAYPTTTAIRNHHTAILLSLALTGLGLQSHVRKAASGSLINPSAQVPVPVPVLVPVTVPRRFSTTNNPPLRKLSSKNLPPRPKPPPEDEIEESFLKGSGPGGQKINKTNSAVQLKHIPTGLVVKCQATRSRSQNRTIARQLLADKLDDMTRGRESRSSVVGEVKRKKKASSAKKSRRKYRKLDDEKGVVAAGELLEDEEGDDLPDRDREYPDESSQRERDGNMDRDTADKATLDTRQQEVRI